MKTFFQLREETSGETLKVSRDIFEAVQELINENKLQQINESEDPAVTKKITKMDQDSYHVATHGHEHVYGGVQPDRDTQVYHVHNTQTGKTHSVAVEHGGEEYSHSAMRKEVPGLNKVSTAASKSIHKDLHDNVL